MENIEKKLTGEESLRIISEMISRTRTNIGQRSFQFLFWGWLIIFCSLAEYLAWNFTDIDSPYLVWLLVVPGVFVSLIYGYSKGKEQKVYTYADRIYTWTWMGFLLTAIVLFVLLSDRLDSVGPYIIMLAGFSTFVSGIIIRFKPLIIGGVCFWIFALIGRFTGPAIAPLTVPLSLVIGYLIPGYLLKNRKEKGNDSL